MFKVLRLPVACLLAALGTIGQANPINVLFHGPINIFGVDWSMSIGDMLTNFENKGYSCEYVENNDYHFCSRDGGGEYDLELKMVIIMNDSVTFNCKVFNGCEYSLEDISKILIDQGFAKEFRLVEDPTNRIEFYKRYYKGEGAAGDALTVIKNIITSSPHYGTPMVRLERGTLPLKRGTFGRGVTFD